MMSRFNSQADELGVDMKNQADTVVADSVCVKWLSRFDDVGHMQKGTGEDRVKPAMHFK